MTALSNPPAPRQPGKPGRVETAQNTTPPLQSETPTTPEASERIIGLGEHLTNHARAACSHGQPHGHLPLSSGSPSQEKIGNVDRRQKDDQDTAPISTNNSAGHYQPATPANGSTSIDQSDPAG